MRAWLVVLSIFTAIELSQAQGQTTQQPNPSFEVASIKANKAGDSRVAMQIQPGGGFRATNVTLRLLIGNAYRSQASQIEGGPSWLNSERFDIVAKARSESNAPVKITAQGQH